MSTLDQSTKPSFMPVAIRYAVIGSLVLIAIDLLTRFTGFVDPVDQSKAMNALIILPINWIIAITIFFLAIKEYREQLGGFISFGNAYVVALVTGLIIAGISAVWAFLYLSVIEPDSLNELKSMLEDQAEQGNPVASFMANSFSPIGMAISAFINRIFLAAIMGLISAAMGQRKDPSLEA